MSTKQVTAIRPGKCFGCQEPINVGDQVICPGPFFTRSHLECEGLARDRLFKPAAKKDPAYVRACGTCGVDPNESCLTATGNKRPVHPTR